MPLVPYDPFRHMENLRQEMSHFFNDNFMNYSQGWRNPRVDIYDHEDEVIASCEIPGLDHKEDVQIEIQDDVLTISGMVHRSQDVKEEHMHRQERFTGRFQRSVRLPHSVSSEGTTASYRNGILEIRMPRSSRSNRKFIDVKFQ